MLTLLFGLNEKTISECRLRLFKRALRWSLSALKTAAKTWVVERSWERAQGRQRHVTDGWEGTDEMKNGEADGTMDFLLGRGQVAAYRSGVKEGVLEGLVALEQLATQIGGILDVLEQGDVHRRVGQVRQHDGLDGGHFGGSR